SSRRPLVTERSFCPERALVRALVTAYSSDVSAFPGYARCATKRDLPDETRPATRPGDSARSAAIRRSSRDTLSAGAGTFNAAYYVPTPAVTSCFPEEPPVPCPACGG